MDPLDKAKTIKALITAETLCEDMDPLDKAKTIKALITASTKDNFDEITTAAETLCVGMTGSDKAKTIEALIKVSADKLAKITNATEKFFLIPDNKDHNKATIISNLNKLTLNQFNRFITLLK